MLALISVAVVAGAASSDRVDPFGVLVLGALGVYLAFNSWRTVQRFPDDIRDRLLFHAGAQVLLVTALSTLILVARAVVGA